MTHYPKISIVTPSFNQGKYLEQTIISVLDQQYPNLEYIIIDGGSTDQTMDIIKKYKHRLAFWISEPDKGMYDAIQKGFDRSIGDIMGWINSDDTLSIRSLFTAAEVFTDYAAIDWLNGLPNQMDEDGRIIAVGGLPRWNKYRYFQMDFKYIQQEGIYWRRKLWENAGSYIDTKFSLAGDLELWSRFFNHAELYYVNGILGTYRARKANQKSLEQIDEYNRQAVELLEKLVPTPEETKIISVSKSAVWKLSMRHPFKFLYKFLKYNSVEVLLNRFPPALYHNRATNRFMIL